MNAQANWDDLRLLLAVSRRGSLLQAGQLLDISTSTVSRRLTQLEAVLGEPVVERGVEGCRLTPRGKSLVEVALAAEEGLRRQTSTSSSSQQAELCGNVLISTGEGFASSVLEAMQRFTSIHPKCSVELLVSADLHKIARGTADIAIRTIHLGEPSLIYRSIGALQYGLFASPEYRHAHPGLTPDTTTLIGLLPPLDALPQMRAAKAHGLKQAHISMSSFAVQLEAVRRGMGAAVLPRILATGLVDLFPEIAIPDMDVYLVTRPQALKQAHTRGFWETLEQVLGETLNPWQGAWPRTTRPSDT